MSYSDLLRDPRWQKKRLEELADDKRTAILADIQAGKKSRGQIARDHKVSPQTVGNIAKDEGKTNAFSRLQTKNATQAAIIDNKAMRVLAAQRLIVKVHEILDQMDQPHMVFNIGGKDNTYTEQLMPKPPTGDLRNLMVTAATAVDKHLVLERHDVSDPDVMGSLLGTLLDGLQRKHGTGDA